MTEIQVKKISSWLIGASAVLIGLGSAKSQVEDIIPSLPQYWASIVVILGILSICFAIGLWLFSKTPPIFVWNDYECHKARKKDLDLIYEFAKQQFGEGISSLQTMQKWYKKNPSVFFVVITERMKPSEIRTKIAGYYCVLPLTDLGIEKIKTGEVRGADIPLEYIARIKKESSAVYVGGIAAKGGRAKAALLAVMNKEFYSNSSRWPKVFYTRPVTWDGVRVAKKKGFVALDPLKNGEINTIYKLEM
jgi:hypothetical protein